MSNFNKETMIPDNSSDAFNNIYDDRDHADIFAEVLEEIEHQLWTKSKHSPGFNIEIDFHLPLDEGMVLAMKKVINIGNSSFMNEFPIFKGYAVGIFICADFLRIKASKPDINQN
jgi:hypothetical protein